MMKRLVLAGSTGAFRGSPVVIACQPQTMPIVWLVEPLGCIASTWVLRSLQLYSSPLSALVTQDWVFSAGK